MDDLIGLQGRLSISGHEILRPHACRSIGSGQEDEGVEGQQHDRQVPRPAGRAEIAPHGGPVLNRGAAAAPGAVRQGREQFVDQGTVVQLVVCDAAPDVDVAVVPLVDPVELGDAEDVDGPVRRRAPAPRVHQDVGAAGEDQKAGVVVQDPQGLVEGLRGEVAPGLVLREDGAPAFAEVGGRFYSVSVALARRAGDRAADGAVAGAAADVARELPANLVVVRLGVPLQEAVGRHDHSGRTEPAVDGPLLVEDDLKVARSLRGPDALDGRDAASGGLDGRDEAGGHQPAVHDDGAGPAFPLPAALLGPRKAQVVPDDVDQPCHRLHVGRAQLPVYGQFYVHRLVSPLVRGYRFGWNLPQLEPPSVGASVGHGLDPLIRLQQLEEIFPRRRSPLRKDVECVVQRR